MKAIRKINNKILLIKSLIYRIFVITTQIIFTWFFLRDVKLAFSISIGWNILNTLEYYGFECLFAKKYDTTVQTEGCVVWLTGLSGSGKSTIATTLKDKLIQQGKRVQILDGDVLRKGISNDLGFSIEDRKVNIQRAIALAKLLGEQDVIVICAFISPLEVSRQEAKDKLQDKYIEVFVNCSLQECETRDVKGLYKKVREGKIKQFTGIDSPYEEPKNPEVICDTETENLGESVNKIMNYLKQRRLI